MPIGYISLGLVSDRVRALPLDGVVPGEATIRDGTYKLVRPVPFRDPGRPGRDVPGTSSISSCRPKARSSIRKEGLLPVR